jgi:2-methylcitrate dehydratase PrpD
MVAADANASTQAARLAREIVAFDAREFGAEPVAKARTCLLDFLSAAFESVELEWSRQARAAMPAGAGAHVVGDAGTRSPADAAFVNAVLGHGLVREDMHAGSISHHGVVIWPVLLALAETGTFSGERLLASAVVGYETGCRVGRALFDSTLARLFRPTGLVGPLGAAAAGAHLLGFDEARTATALALAANCAGGLNQWPHSGASDMYFHPGFGARNVVTALHLAAAGAYGSPDIFEGEAGLFAAFARRQAPPVTLFPKGEPDILNVYNKPVGACNFAQTALQAAYRLAQELTSDAARIEHVAIRVSDAARRYPGCDFTGPFERALQAKMSIQYGVAATLARRRLGEANYQRLDDLETLRLVAACGLEVDADFTSAFPAAQGAEVEITLVDGRRLRTSLRDVVPATEAEIRNRCREAASMVLGAGRAEEVEAAMDGLDGLADAGLVPRLCAATGPAARH